MTKLILKAVSSPKSAASAAVDQVVGQVDTASGAQRLSISAQANTQYRLVDSKTGQVIKNQTVLRKGKTLQIEVEGKNLVELDNFFPNEASDAAPQAPSATYLVDTHPPRLCPNGSLSLPGKRCRAVPPPTAQKS